MRILPARRGVVPATGQPARVQDHPDAVLSVTADDAEAVRRIPKGDAGHHTGRQTDIRRSKRALRSGDDWLAPPDDADCLEPTVRLGDRCGLQDRRPQQNPCLTASVRGTRRGRPHLLRNFSVRSIEQSSAQVSDGDPEIVLAGCQRGEIDETSSGMMPELVSIHGRSVLQDPYRSALTPRT